jgi:hypothetical protein
MSLRRPRRIDGESRRRIDKASGVNPSHCVPLVFVMVFVMVDDGRVKQVREKEKQKKERRNISN